MDLGCTGLTQQIHDPAAGRAAHNGIVDQHDAFPCDRFTDRTQLELYAAVALRLRRRNKCPSDVFVFDEADAVGNAGCLRKSERGIQSRIRHADDSIRIHRMRRGEQCARLFPCRMNGNAVQNRIRTRKIDILKNTGALRRSAAVSAVGLHPPVRCQHDHFSGFEIAQEFRADCGKRTALRCGHIAALRQPADAERPESVRIADGDQLLRGHQDQRKCALQLRDRKPHGILDRIGLQSRLRDEIRNDLGIARRVEDRAALFEHTAQSARIAEIAVVDKRHFSLMMIDLHRLTVPPLTAAGRAVARMTDRDPALRKAAEDLRRKDMIDEAEILMRREYAVIIDRDPCAFLPAVL